MLDIIKLYTGALILYREWHMKSCERKELHCLLEWVIELGGKGLNPMQIFDSLIFLGCLCFINLSLGALWPILFEANLVLQN